MVWCTCFRMNPIDTGKVNSFYIYERTTITTKQIYHVRFFTIIYFTPNAPRRTHHTKNDDNTNNYLFTLNNPLIQV